MARRIVALAALAALAGLAASVYARWFWSPTLAEAPQYVDDTSVPLPKADEFEHLAEKDPVAMYEKCLSRYQREVTNGFAATLLKEEVVQGSPHAPEVVKLSVRGDVPGAAGGAKIQVLMVWEKGAQKAPLIGSEIRATLYSEDKGGNQDDIAAWIPGLSSVVQIPLNGSKAKAASRYCIRDAGMYRGMLRTYEAWKERKEAGTLNTKYLGKQKVEKLGGRECYVVERICPSPEVDSFEVGGKPDTRAATVAKEGFARVKVMIDAETWLQVGTELYRPDGKLLASYYFRDIDLNPTFADETFTVTGLKKK